MSRYVDQFFSAKLKLWLQDHASPDVVGRMGFLKHPIVHEPGQAWHYGYGIDWAERYVESLAGEPFESYCKRRIFDPLGCKDVRFNWVRNSTAHVMS